MENLEEQKWKMSKRENISDFIYFFITVRICNLRKFIQVFGNVKRKTGRKWVSEVHRTIENKKFGKKSV